MGLIYEVRAQHGDRVHSFGAARTRDEAEQKLAAARAQVATAGGHNDRYWIEEIDTDGMFEVPSRPVPRERFTTRVTPTSPEGAWRTVRVEIMDADRVIATYERNYSMLQTFEPFRQGGRNLALISPDYTATSVIDLDSGQIIAAEEPSSGGFCPVGFYVPDWWDVHGDTKLPGSMYWNSDS